MARSPASPAPRAPLALLLPFAALALLLACEGLLARPLSFLTGIGVESIRRGELAALIGVGALLLARAARRDVVHGILERRVGKALPQLIGDMAALLVLVVGAAVVMVGVLGQDVGAVVATGGLGLAVIGIALRDVILAMFTGVAISVENSFVVGERVKIGDVEGTVVQTTWRSTTLLTGARRLVSIPNATLGTAAITNFDRPDKSEARTLEICLDYDITIQSAERVLLAGVLGATGAQLVDTPSVVATRLDKDGVVYRIGYVVADNAAGSSADHAVIRSVLARLRDAGFGVAYPKQEVVNAAHRIRVADRVFDRRVLVEQCALFRDLAPAVREGVAEAMGELELRAGTPLLAAGESRPSLFIVGEGLIRRMRARPDRPGLVEERYVATQAFGQRALLNDLPHTATTSAVTQSLVFELTRPALAAILAAHPEAKRVLAASLARLPSLEAATGGGAGPWPDAAGQAPAFYFAQLEAIEAEHRRTRAPVAGTINLSLVRGQNA